MSSLTLKDHEIRDRIRKDFEDIRTFLHGSHHKHRHSRASKLCDKVNDNPALANNVYALYKKQGWIEKYILHKKKQRMSPQEQRDFENELLEREKVILGDLWNEDYDWGWFEMSGLIDIPASAKRAGVKPFDGFEIHTLGNVKKDRELGIWKDFKTRHGFYGV